MIAAIKKKFSGVTRFLFLAAAVFTVLTVVFAVISNIIIKQSFYTRVRNSTGRNIQFEAGNFLTAGDFSSGNTARTEDVFSRLFQMVRTSEIVRIKVWDTQSRIIYSNDNFIEGESHEDNLELRTALQGSLTLNKVSGPQKAGDISAQGLGQLVEVYVPIIFEGNPKPVGVIEVYFSLTNVMNQIRNTQEILLVTILVFVSVSFILFYVLLRILVLRESEFVRKVIDTNPGLIFVKDWNGKFTLVNKATADIYNTTIDTLVGKTDADFNPNTEEVKSFLAADRQVMETGKPSLIIEEPVTDVSTGKQRWFQTIKVPLISGRSKQILGISTEITQRKQAEEMMSLQTAALESAENTVFITDTEGVIQWVNPAFTRLTGYSAEDAIGNTPRILKSGKQPLAYYKHLWDTILGGNPWHSEVEDKGKGGNLYMIDQTITPVKDQKGKVINFVAIQQDISERKRAEKNLEDSKNALINVLEDLRREKIRTESEKAKDEAILASIGDGLLATDAGGKIIVMNKVAEEMLGLGIGEGIGKQHADIFSLGDDKGAFVRQAEHPLSKALSSAATTSSNVVSTFYITRKDNVRFPVAITVSPVVLDRKVIGAIEVFRDITHEKEVDKAKTEFVSLASHQLRTPLSTIGWYTEMLLSGDAGIITDKQKNYLDEIYDGNKRLVELVNSLLNVSRIEMETFGIEPQEVQVKDVVDNVLKDITADVTMKKLKVEVSYGDVQSVLADPKLLRLIFENLLTNAVRYTPEGGTITVTAAKHPQEILFIVSDTGIGISKKDTEKIFTKLYRADNARALVPGGTGLGLYMVKSILEHAGGGIRFESEEGKGSTFYVTIPLTGMKKKSGEKGIIP